MPDLKISQLPAANPLDGSETFCCVQDGETRKTRLPLTVAFFGAKCRGQDTFGSSTLTQAFGVNATIYDTGGFLGGDTMRFNAPYKGVYRASATADFGLLDFVAMDEEFLLINVGLASAGGDGAFPAYQDGTETNPSNFFGISRSVSSAWYAQAGDFFYMSVERNGTGSSSATLMQVDAQFEIQFMGDVSISPPPPPPPAPLFEANFLGSGTISLDSYSPEIGNAGVTLGGTWVRIPGAAVCTSSSDNDLFAFDATAADCSFTVNTAVDGTGGIVQIASFAFRMQDSTNFWLLFPNINSGSLDLYECVAGSFSLIDSQPATYANPTVLLGILLIGPTAQFFVDGVFVYQETGMTDFLSDTSFALRFSGVPSVSDPCEWLSILVTP